MISLLQELSPMQAALVLGLLGIAVGTLLSWWIEYLTPEAGVAPRMSAVRFLPIFGALGALLSRNPELHRAGRERLSVELGTAVVFAIFVFAMLGWNCQETTSVIPSETWRIGRIYYQLILITFLVAATGTDFREYVIPDAITLPGTFIGLAGAIYSGELQMIHLWIDWNNEVPLIGPYIPAWIDQHRHLHGLAWSGAGIIVGAGLTWLVRFISSVVLKQEALGAGDVTLMAMIGSFVGWQPVLMIFLVAPWCGMVIALLVRAVTGRSFVPYGPYLAAGTYVILLSWRWVWPPMRFIFGHGPSLAILAVVFVAGLILLLALLRLYRAIPVTRRTPTKQEPET